MSAFAPLAVFNRLAMWLFWPAVAVVVWGELRPPGEGPAIWDKALHFTAYFGLAGLATVAVRVRRQASVLAVLGLVAMGGLLEIVQGLTGRDMSAWDELANTLGAIAGALAGWAFYRLMVALGEGRARD